MANILQSAVQPIRDPYGEIILSFRSTRIHSERPDAPASHPRSGYPVRPSLSSKPTAPRSFLPTTNRLGPLHHHQTCVNLTVHLSPRWLVSDNDSPQTTQAKPSNYANHAFPWVRHRIK